VRGGSEIASGAGGGAFEDVAEGVDDVRRHGQAAVASRHQLGLDAGDLVTLFAPTGANEMLRMRRSAGHAGEDNQPTRSLIGRATDVSGGAVA
jgi:hypothetical protein